MGSRYALWVIGSYVVMNRIATLGSRKFYWLHSLQGVLKLYIRMELKSMPVEILI